MIGKIFAKVLIDRVVESTEKMEVMWAVGSRKCQGDVQVRVEVDARV